MDGVENLKGGILLKILLLSEGNSTFPDQQIKFQLRS